MPSIEQETCDNPNMVQLQQEVVACAQCPRLIDWCQTVAREKRKQFQDELYWGRPVPSFGDYQARLLIVGLAPAAHGANRTGRMFTGDRSGDWLYRALYRAGFANQPDCVNQDDGLMLSDALVSATCRCAPPQNKVTAEEIANCRPFLLREIEALSDLRVILALGKVAFDGVLRTLYPDVKQRPKATFGHGVSYPFGRKTNLC